MKASRGCETYPFFYNPKEGAVFKKRLAVFGVLAMTVPFAATSFAAAKSDLAAARSDSVAEASHAAKVRTVRIEMGEFYFKPAVFRLKAGERVKLVITNRGQLTHEFMAGQKVRMENGEPEGYVRDFFAGLRVKYTGTGRFERKPGHGTEFMADAGQYGTLTFTVPRNRIGKWEFGCFVPGHYQAGQKGTLLIVR